MPEALTVMKESGAIPSDFWYAATLILTIILITFLGIFIGHLKTYLKDDKEYKAITTDAIREIKEAVLIIRTEQKHDRKDIEEHTAEIRELKKRRRS